MYYVDGLRGCAGHKVFVQCMAKSVQSVQLYGQTYVDTQLDYEAQECSQYRVVLVLQHTKNILDSPTLW